MFMKDMTEQDALWELFEKQWPTDVPSEPISLPNEVDDFIIDKIKDALIECNNNRTHTAEHLGLKRETLLAKMKKYELF